MSRSDIFFLILLFVYIHMCMLSFMCAYPIKHLIMTLYCYSLALLLFPLLCFEPLNCFGYFSPYVISVILVRLDLLKTE